MLDQQHFHYRCQLRIGIWLIAKKICWICFLFNIFRNLHYRLSFLLLRCGEGWIEPEVESLFAEAAWSRLGLLADDGDRVVAACRGQQQGSGDVHPISFETFQVSCE